MSTLHKRTATVARPSKALLRFVELYTNGPDRIKGQWDLCANAAMLPEPPDRNNKTVRMLIERAGGVVLQQDMPPTPDSNLSKLEQVLTLGEAEVIPWRKLKSELTNVIRDIATGVIQARASQVQVLRLIIEKAEQAAAEEEEVHSVVVVPTQGSNAGLTIDEEWMRKIKNMAAAQDDVEPEPEPNEETQSRDSVDPESGAADSIPSSDS